MSRIRNAWRALMGVEPELIMNDVEVAAHVDEPVGPLFGLAPPDDCYFDVKYDQSYPVAWFVRIKRGDETLAMECAISRGEGDEEMILRAARKAISAYERGQKVKAIEGCYPPKRAKGAK